MVQAGNGQRENGGANGASVQDCVVRRARQAGVLVFSTGHSTYSLAQPVLLMLRTASLPIAWPWVAQCRTVGL